MNASHKTWRILYFSSSAKRLSRLLFPSTEGSRVHIPAQPSLLGLVLSILSSSLAHNVKLRDPAFLEPSSILTYLKSIKIFLKYSIKTFRSWRALEIVRMRHFKASSTTKHTKHGVVSQRDMGLTVCAFFGFAVLHPEKLGIRASQPGDWDAFVFSWRVILYMLGIEER